jgi:acyl phosphate:glycerol-3-phosphate acyltransferase
VAGGGWVRAPRAVPPVLDPSHFTHFNKPMLSTVAPVLLAYLLGSLSAAIIVCRMLRLPDPRLHGSHNPGATNVLRLGGKRAAAYVLLGDMLKGLLPVLAAKLLAVSNLTLALVGLAAFLGHLYPVFFGFQGGKGVATSLGVLLGLSWWVGLAVIATWLLTALLFRYSSLSAMVAAILAPAYVAWLAPVREWVAGVAVMSAVLLWRHRSNIRNLLEGREDKIGGKR